MMSLRSLLIAPFIFMMVSAAPALRALAKQAPDGASAVESLHVELPNPPNAWKDEKTDLWYSQTQVREALSVCLVIASRERI